jgi:hypothetical protein
MPLNDNMYATETWLHRARSKAKRSYDYMESTASSSTDGTGIVTPKSSFKCEDNTSYLRIGKSSININTKKRVLIRIPVQKAINKVEEKVRSAFRPRRNKSRCAKPTILVTDTASVTSGPALAEDVPKTKYDDTFGFQSNANVTQCTANTNKVLRCQLKGEHAFTNARELIRNMNREASEILRPPPNIAQKPAKVVAPATTLIKIGNKQRDSAVAPHRVNAIKGVAEVSVPAATSSDTTQKASLLFLSREVLDGIKNATDDEFLRFMYEVGDEITSRRLRTSSNFPDGIGEVSTSRSNVVTSEEPLSTAKRTSVEPDQLRPVSASSLLREDLSSGGTMSAVAEEKADSRDMACQKVEALLSSTAKSHHSIDELATKDNVEEGSKALVASSNSFPVPLPLASMNQQDSSSDEGSSEASSPATSYDHNDSVLDDKPLVDDSGTIVDNHLGTEDLKLVSLETVGSVCNSEIADTESFKPEPVHEIKTAETTIKFSAELLPPEVLSFLVPPEDFNDSFRSETQVKPAKSFRPYYIDKSSFSNMHDLGCCNGSCLDKSCYPVERKLKLLVKCNEGEESATKIVPTNVENHIFVHMKGPGGLVLNPPYDRLTVHGQEINDVYIVSDPEELEDDVKEPCKFRIELTNYFHTKVVVYSNVPITRGLVDCQILHCQEAHKAVEIIDIQKKWKEYAKVIPAAERHSRELGLVYHTRLINLIDRPWDVLLSPDRALFLEDDIAHIELASSPGATLQSRHKIGRQVFELGGLVNQTGFLAEIQLCDYDNLDRHDPPHMVAMGYEKIKAEAWANENKNLTTEDKVQDWVPADDDTSDDIDYTKCIANCVLGRNCGRVLGGLECDGNCQECPHCEFHDEEYPQCFCEVLYPGEKGRCGFCKREAGLKKKASSMVEWIKHTELSFVGEKWAGPCANEPDADEDEENAWEEISEIACSTISDENDDELESDGSESCGGDQLEDGNSHRSGSCDNSNGPPTPQNLVDSSSGHYHLTPENLGLLSDTFAKYHKENNTAKVMRPSKGFHSFIDSKEHEADKVHNILVNFEGDFEIRFFPAAGNARFSADKVELMALPQRDPRLAEKKAEYAHRVDLMRWIKCIIYSNAPITKIIVDASIPDAALNSPYDDTMMRHIEDNWEQYREMAPFARESCWKYLGQTMVYTIEEMRKLRAGWLKKLV